MKQSQLIKIDGNYMMNIGVILKRKKQKTMIKKNMKKKQKIKKKMMLI